MLLRTFAIASIAASSLLGPSAGRASAQAVMTIRVVGPSADVMIRPTVKAEVLATLPAQTTLEALDKEGQWYWVLLNRDSSGTQRAGWVHESDIEVVVQAQPRFYLEPSPPGDRPAKIEKAKKVNDRALRKAERDLEKARREYEKLTEPRGESTPPDEDAAIPHDR